MLAHLVVRGPSLFLRTPWGTLYGRELASPPRSRPDEHDFVSSPGLGTPVLTPGAHPPTSSREGGSASKVHTLSAAVDNFPQNLERFTPLPVTEVPLAALGLLAPWAPSRTANTRTLLRSLRFPGGCSLPSTSIASSRNFSRGSSVFLPPFLFVLSFCGTLFFRVAAFVDHRSFKHCPSDLGFFVAASHPLWSRAYTNFRSV